MFNITYFMQTTQFTNKTEPCLTPLYQSVATRAVNPGVVSSNPSSSYTFIPTFDKSRCDKRHSFFTNGLIVYVVKKPVAWKVCCVVYWCEKARKYMSRWTGRRDLTEIMLKTALKLNKSIKPKLDISAAVHIENISVEQGKKHIDD